LLSLSRLASRAFINHEIRIPPTDAPGVAAPSRIAFMEGSRGGFVDDLRSGIGSGSIGKEEGRMGLSISFMDISASSRMRSHSSKAVMTAPWGDGQSLVCLCESINRRCEDFDGQESVCLWESLDRCVVGTLIGRPLFVRGVYGFFKAAFLWPCIFTNPNKA
jgi:hypothetical protein